MGNGFKPQNAAVITSNSRVQVFDVAHGGTEHTAEELNDTTEVGGEVCAALWALLVEWHDALRAARRSRLMLRNKYELCSVDSSNRVRLGCKYYLHDVGSAGRACLPPMRPASSTVATVGYFFLDGLLHGARALCILPQAHCLR